MSDGSGFERPRPVARFRGPTTGLAVFREPLGSAGDARQPAARLMRYADLVVARFGVPGRMKLTTVHRRTAGHEQRSAE